ncbi:MAG: integration host factor subunit beta [Paludibacteraceae bacterium]|nr:integration host factor subunit beta [Paludibacteraceae bacterium]MBQ2190127.1 integration host factor subunit beta [Paludibacteraceae bacterium]
MTKADLINEMAISTGYDKKTVSVIVESFMEGVKGSLAKGESVYLRGFGTFTLKTRKAKIARNISKNTSIQVPEHKIAFFKAASELAEAVR